MILSTLYTFYNILMQQKPRKRWRYILLLIVLIIGYNLIWSSTIHPPASVVIKKGDTVQTFIAPLSFTERMRAKWYLMRHAFDAKKLQSGTYLFSGNYDITTYFAQIIAWPSHDYVRYTMLEWRSIYDIDADMSAKWLIATWSFIARAQSSEEIQKLSQTFAFLKQEKPLTTLEWFLYPDTYFLSSDADPISQLFQASLRRWDEKIYGIWQQYSSQFMLALQPYSIKLSLPWTIALASIIEKEERNIKEKPTIAGIFLNRLQNDITLGADITLCYGRQQPYETCTPKLIAQYVSDSSNIYNTRIQKWLTPTPISSITVDTFKALLQFKPSNYLFYLHDAQWNIHYAETNTQHEQNKAAYLQ
jgi:UPF0755 protein